MSKRIVLILFFSFILAGCQTTPEPNHVSSSPTKSVDSAVPKDDASSVIPLETMGLSMTILTPKFDARVATKNGDYKLTTPGNTRYFAVSEKDDALTDEQFRAYCTTLYEHVQSIADQGKILGFDVKSMSVLDALASADDSSMTSPMAISYTYQGKTYGLYVQYKNYKPGTFVEYTNAVNAIYIGAFAL